MVLACTKCANKAKIRNFLVFTICAKWIYKTDLTNFLEACTNFENKAKIRNFLIFVIFPKLTYKNRNYTLSNIYRQFKMNICIDSKTLTSSCWGNKVELNCQSLRKIRTPLKI